MLIVAAPWPEHKAEKRPFIYFGTVKLKQAKEIHYITVLIYKHIQFKNN